MFAAALVAVLIVVLTLVVSPAQGDALDRALPSGSGSAPVTAATPTDVCVGGIPCEDGHAFAFLALGCFAAVYVSVSRPPAERVRALATLAAALVAFAAVDEWAQGWAGRDPSFADWTADLVGIALGVVLGSQGTRVLLRR